MLDDGKYPRIGNHDCNIQSSVYELVIYDFLKILDPPQGFQLEKIDPQDFFVTSGDAIQKTEYLSRRLWEYAGAARSQLKAMHPQTKVAKEFEKMCWTQAGASLKLMNKLKSARGSAIFLETEWNEHVLTLRPKNPRDRGRRSKYNG